ncbi:MAG: phage portal protein [Stellaceae bacterium]
MSQSGQATPIAPGLIGRARQGVRYIISGVTPTTWFGPMQPLRPQAPADVAGRQFDYPVGYNLTTRPRADAAISFPQLRALADNCDLLRTVIETRKDQIERLEWTIRHRALPDGDPAAAGRDPRIAEIENFLRMPDRVNFWSAWLRQLLEDLFVIDAPAIYLRRTRAGGLHALEPIDGATVKRLLNADGRTPAAPDPAYQQVLHGLPAVDLSTGDLLYRPRNLRTHRAYGFSPVEQIVMTVNIALRRQMFQLSYYTEGNVPEALIGTPESWGPNQIKEFQQYWDALLEGNLAQRRHAKFVPGGVAKTFIPTKDAELKNDYDEWLARVICFAFSISPQPFVEHMNRATAQTAHDTALSEGLAPIQSWIKALIDYIIVTEFDAGDLEFEWRDDIAPDLAIAAGIAETYVKNGIKSVNEVRAEIGLEPVPGGERPTVLTTTGPVPLIGASLDE